MYKKIQTELAEQDIEIYREAYRRIYYEEGVFKNKKSRELLEKSLQELNPSLHYSEQTEEILKAIAKLFLIELFEKSVEAREVMPHKTDIDEEVLEEAYQRIKNS